MPSSRRLACLSSSFISLSAAQHTASFIQHVMCVSDRGTGMGALAGHQSTASVSQKKQVAAGRCAMQQREWTLPSTDAKCHLDDAEKRSC